LVKVSRYSKPCECDLYLTCSKFVTTPEYAGRLRDRVAVEEELIADAEERGRGREAERHQRIRARVIDLLTELNEPLHPPKMKAIEQSRPPTPPNDVAPQRQPRRRPPSNNRSDSPS